MEATTLLTLPLIIFLSLTTNGVSASRGISNTVYQSSAVVDSSGNELQSGQSYYLEPVTVNFLLYSSAVVPVIVRHGTVWLQLETDVHTYDITGLSVKFSPVEPTEDKTIYESTVLNIKYTDELARVSGGSSVWKVDEFLTLGGAEDDRFSWFKIQKGSRTGIYKLVSSFNTQFGRNIGVIERTYGAGRLALAKEPVEFTFRPVTSASK